MSFGQYILDDAGEPVPCEDLMTWARWFENTEARRLAMDTVDGITVSTVFLGLDQARIAGLPILWETMAWREGDEHREREFVGPDELGLLPVFDI